MWIGLKFDFCLEDILVEPLCIHVRCWIPFDSLADPLQRLLVLAMEFVGRAHVSGSEVKPRMFFLNCRESSQCLFHFPREQINDSCIVVNHYFFFFNRGLMAHILAFPTGRTLYSL